MKPIKLLIIALTALTLTACASDEDKALDGHRKTIELRQNVVDVWHKWSNTPDLDWTQYTPEEAHEKQRELKMQMFAELREAYYNYQYHIEEFMSKTKLLDALDRLEASKNPEHTKLTKAWAASRIELEAVFDVFRRNGQGEDIFGWASRKAKSDFAKGKRTTNFELKSLPSDHR